MTRECCTSLYNKTFCVLYERGYRGNTWYFRTNSESLEGMKIGELTNDDAEQNIYELYSRERFMAKLSLFPYVIGILWTEYEEKTANDLIL